MCMRTYFFPGPMCSLYNPQGTRGGTHIAHFASSNLVSEPYTFSTTCSVLENLCVFLMWFYWHLHCDPRVFSELSVQKTTACPAAGHCVLYVLFYFLSAMLQMCAPDLSSSPAINTGSHAHTLPLWHPILIFFLSNCGLPHFDWVGVW